jgi:hypothetical protein
MRSFMISLTLISLSAVAYAGDPAQKVNSESNPIISGYFDVHGGYYGGYDDWYWLGVPNSSAKYNGTDLGAIARTSVQINSNFSVQGDAWLNNYHYKTGTDFTTTNYSGVGFHATFKPTNTDQAGFVESLGNFNSVGYLNNKFNNIGVEWVHDFDNWRIYSQIGYVSEIDGVATHANFKDFYGTVVATYYFSPNFSLSSNFMIDRLTSTDGIKYWPNVSNDLAWGSKVEYKIDNLPLIGYVGYHGNSYHENYYSGQGLSLAIESTIIVGIKIPFGQDTIKNLDRHVGLADLNPIFGDFTH